MRAFSVRKKRGATWRAVLATSTLLLAAYGPSPAYAVSPPPHQEASPAGVRAQDTRRLESGRPVEREIAPGETHGYELSLDAGQLVRLAVEPQKATLVLTLIDPGGGRLEEFELRGDSPIPTPVAFVTEAPGGYRLEMRSHEKSPPGHYTLGVEAVRAAGPMDKVRVKAERAFAEGQRLQFAQGGAEALTEAIKKYEQALALWHEAGDRANEGDALGAIGSAHLSLSDPRQGVVYYSKKLDVVRELGDARQEAVTSEEIGRLYYSPLRQKTNALTYLDDALRLHREADRQEAAARTLTTIGKVYAELGGSPDEQRKSLDYFIEALGIQRTLKNRFYEGDALGNLMLALKAMRRRREAIFFGAQAVDVFQGIRAGISDLERGTQETFVKSKEAVYRALAALLIEEGRLSEAWEVLNMLKEEEYADFIRRSGGRVPPHVQQADRAPREEEWEKQYNEIADRLAEIGRRRGELFRKEPKTEEDKRLLSELNAKVGLAFKGFDKFFGKLSRELGSKPGGKERARAFKAARALVDDLNELGPDVVALYSLVSEEKYYVLLITPELVRAYDYNITSVELAQKVSAFRLLLHERKEDPLPGAQELYRILVGRVAKDLEDSGAKTLMWSLDGVLRYVPMSALHDGEKYMIERYSNSIFTPVDMPRLKDNPSPKWEGVGFGITKAHGGLDPLSSVLAELNAIFRIAAPAGKEPSGVIPGEVVVDDDFTKEKLTEMLDLERYKLVHIASHFVFFPSSEANSYLLLGKGYHLPLSEIGTSVRFRGVELLTLSACDTGAPGGDDNGKEVEGFAVLAQQSGAKAVVASLWRVGDVSTQVLMQDFYRFRAAQPGVTKAEALRQAQLSLLRGGESEKAAEQRGDGAAAGDGNAQADAAKVPFKHPYFWAPFQLIGNWK